MLYELYVSKNENIIHIEIPEWEKFTLKYERVTPKICGWMFALYWNIATLGEVKAYTIYDKDILVHYSFVVRSRAKFTFLKEGDIEIGPCWTHIGYRGKGLYPRILTEILKRELKGGVAFMLIRDTNIASQNGVKKAGFTKTDWICTKDVLKRWSIGPKIISFDT